MNKQHTGKLLAFLLAVVFMFTLIPQVFADEGDDIGKWTYIHDMNGGWDKSLVGNNQDNVFAYNNEAFSSIEITESDGTRIDPDAVGDNLHYKDIPVGAKITLQIAFHFDSSSGAGSFYNNAKKGDYFVYQLPQGVEFTGSLAGSIKDKDQDDIVFATWTVANGVLTVTLTDAFNDDDSFQPIDLWGLIGISGEFKAVEEGDEGQQSTSLDFGGQTVTIDRQESSGGEEDEFESVLSKSHVYDPVTNQIEWTVVLTPPDENESFKYGGYTLLDQLSDNHSYVAGSFYVNKTQIVDEDESLKIEGKKLSYTFPDDAAGTQTIKYKSQIDEIEPGETNDYVNTANLKHNGKKQAKEVDSTFSLGGFLQKVGGELTERHGNYYIEWTVKLTVLKSDSGFSFPNARLVDKLTDLKHDYETTEFDVKIKNPDGSTAILTSGEDKGQYKIVEVEKVGSTTGEKDKYLIYRFPYGAPKSLKDGDQVYELTYYTKVLDWDQNLGTNEEVKIKNEAWFEWGGDGDIGGEGSFGTAKTEVEKKVKPAKGLINKSTPSLSSNVYDHTVGHQYIPWTIVINASKVTMDWSKISVTDTVNLSPPYGQHRLEISDTHTLTIIKNEEPTATATFTSISESPTGDGGFILYKEGNGFKLKFPSTLGNTTDTYTITFYTKVEDEDLYNGEYNKVTKTYRNEAELAGYSTNPIGVWAERKYNFQMLNKTSTAYDPVTRKLSYQLVVNRNRLPLQNAVITDFLPTDTLLWSDSYEEPVNYTSHITVKVNDGAEESLSKITNMGLNYPKEITDDEGNLRKNAFTLSLPDTALTDEFGDQYTIKFSIYLEDGALLNSDPEIENKVELSLPTNDATFRTSDKTTIDYKTIQKKHDYKAGKDTITWAVEINPGRVILEGASVWDILNPALELVDGSIKLYYASVETNGSLIKGDEVSQADWSFNLTTVKEDPDNSASPDLKKFTVSLPDGAHAFVLRFETNIVKDGVTIKNVINLSGETNSPTGEGKSTTINVTRLYSSGGSGTRELKIKKVDDNGEALKGATFQLLTDNLQPFKYRGPQKLNTAKTDSDGIAVFEGLPNWTFFVKEIAPAPGYLIPSEKGAPLIFGPFKSSAAEGDTPISIENKLALADFSIIKKDYRVDPDNRKGLADAIFEIVNDEGTDTPLFRQEKRSGTDGSVNFVDIPLGTYLIREITPPQGYEEISSDLKVTVDYSDDTYTSTKVEFTPPTGGEPDIMWDGEHYVFINRFKGRIEIIKVGETDNRLKDVGFRLLVKDGEGFKEYLDDDNNKRQGKTGPDGTLIFGELAPGEYYLEEISAPDNYKLPDEDELVKVTIPLGDGIYHIEKKLTNKLLRAFIQISKEGPSGEPLDGGLFELTKPGDASFQVMRMPAEGGVVTFEQLLPGTYQIEEIEPPFGYAINEDKKIVKVVLKIDKPNQLLDIRADSEASKRITNDYDGKITIKKIAGSRPLAGVTFELLDGDKQSFSPKKTLTTTSTGIVEFTGLPLGTYYVRETAAPSQYHLPATLHEFVLTGVKTDNTVGWHKEKEIRNYLLTDSIILTKTDPKGVALDGGWFGLYTNPAATGEPMDKVQADGGQVVFTGILPGIYYVREIEAPAGYIKSDEIIKVDVSLAGTNGIVGEVVKDPLINDWAGVIT